MESTREMFTRQVSTLTERLNEELERNWTMVEDRKEERYGTTHCWRWYDNEMYLMGEIAFAFGGRSASFTADLHWSGSVHPWDRGSTGGTTEFGVTELYDAAGYINDFLRAEA